MPEKRNADESFEKKLSRLESIVQKMESGTLNLKDALKTYEDGMKIASELNQSLNAAEERMHELIGTEEIPLEEDDA